MTRVWAAFLALLLALVSLGGTAAAQEGMPQGGVAAAAGDQPAYDDPDWESLSQRTADAVDAARVSDFTLENLRAELAIWRDLFLDLQDEHTRRISTLQGQIDALGPAEDAEPDRIASRREALQLRLDEMQVPVRLATEAHRQADGLIDEIDDLLRDRWTETLAERVVTPLNPTVWPTTWSRLVSGVRAVVNETRTAWSNDIRRSSFGETLPVIGVFVVIATVLVLRGRRWVAALEARLGRKNRRGRALIAFVVSLGQIILPFLGVFAFTAVALSSGLLGLRGSDIAASLPPAALHVIVARWLASQLFTPAHGRDNPLSLDDDAAHSMRRLLVGMSWALAVSTVVRAFADANSMDPAYRGLLLFPLGVVVALFLYWIGRLLRRPETVSTEGPDTPEPETRPYRFVLASLVAQVLGVGALLAVALGAFGYSAVFELLIYSTASTLYLLGVLVILQGLVFDLYSLLVRSDDGASAQEALVPVLIGFLLTFAAMPILALIWGFRATELTELWTRFREGFQIGTTQISPTDFLTFVAVFFLGYVMTRLLQGALRTTVLPKTKLDIGGQNAIVAGLGYIGIFLAALVAITTAGIDLSGLAIVAGALSVGIGFGLQTIVSNFVSGIILLIERPISQGDWIEVGGQMGYVRDISVRSTRIETFDRTDVIIPNADLVSGQVTNWTRGNSVGRVIVPVGVAYGTDTERVTGILKEVAESHPLVLLNPAPAVLFRGFGADSLDFEIRAILRDVNWVLNVQSEMNHLIAKKFVEEGIEIPFAQRDIWLRNPEALRPGGHVPLDEPQMPEDAPEMPGGDSPETPEEPA